MGALSGLTKQQASRKIAEDTNTFLENGGEIEYVPYDPQPEMAARVGRWLPLGDASLGDFIDGFDPTETLPDDLLTFGYQWDKHDADFTFDEVEHFPVDESVEE